MSGVFLRKRTHECSPPWRDVLPGDVWACDCGHRWTCIWSDTGFNPFPAKWERRWWPWPRAPRESPPIDTEQDGADR